ncbi:MAG: hypothetical protein LUE11_11820 [Clostridia bacterium]|nr:hypothetical protein [Clostridia bacterium]
MKRTVAVLSMCCVTLFALLMYQHFSVDSGSASVPVSDTISAEEQTEDQPLYVVRADDGVLCIYPYGSSTAAEVTDIRLSSLREYDQELIKRGFPLYTEQELTSFLEDFGS